MSFLRIITRLRAFSAVVMLAVVTCATQPAYSSESDNADLLGTWKLTRVLDSSEISSIGDREAARLVGKRLVIGENEISLDGETCPNPEFDRHVEQAAKYIREQAHAPVGRLGLQGDFVTVVDLACSQALLKGHKKMVIYWKGFFFDAVKQSPSRPRQPAKN